jgi:hypothetical protein
MFSFEVVVADVVFDIRLRCLVVFVFGHCHWALENQPVLGASKPATFEVPV